ncbi:membrane protein [Paenibacillus sp. CCS19]|uniref:YitT family protein n=1 Tax=Paenibacillus sp. CCS19 TaxID=3158387 RepID=UPI00256305A0|nr:YitT family protein [Paenibacillus cellulosilyticus]GMK38279.1 membrane protein [Paenibacillus cellulosilyticus]
MTHSSNSTASRQRRRRAAGPANPRTQAIWAIAQLLVGAFIIAASFNLFLVPNGIASGGVSGLSIIVKQVLGIQPAYTQWIINIPLFFAGLWLLGKRFALKSLLGSFTLPLFVLLTAHWPPPTDNPLLAAVYGGVGVGIGLGLVFRGRGSTGGTDLAAQILHKYTGLSLGITVVCFDGLVIALAGILISPENALYALIALFVTSKTIDLLQTGLALSKVAFIISDRTEELADAVLTQLDRGLTELDAHGGYTGQRRVVLMVVVSQNEVPKLKAIIRSVDPGAFVIISQTAEVIGQGFKIE